MSRGRQQLVAEGVEIVSIPGFRGNGDRRTRRSPHRKLRARGYSAEVVEPRPLIPAPHAAAPAMSDSERERLILDHQKFAENMAWKLLKQWQIRLNRDEVTSDACLALCAAARTFDPLRGVAFSTLLFHHVRGVLLKHVTKLVKHQRVTQAAWSAAKDGNEDELQAVMPHGADDALTPEHHQVNRENRSGFLAALSILSPLERRVIEKWIFEDKSLVDVAAELGYSRGHISRLKSLALEKLAELLPRPATR